MVYILRTYAQGLTGHLLCLDIFTTSICTSREMKLNKKCSKTVAVKCPFNYLTANIECTALRISLVKRRKNT